MTTMLVLCVVMIALMPFLNAGEATQEGELPPEKFEDYLKSHGKIQSLGVVPRQSEKSDTNFYPKYMKGQEIKYLCITSRPDYEPCLGTFTPPAFSAPEGHSISYYVWESDKKAAVGFFISTFRAKALKYNYEFEELRSLEKLRIIDHSVNNVADAFYESRELVELDLHSNVIKRLIGSNFLWTEKLEKLNLSGNKISSIKEDTFNSLKSLKEMDLSGNPLKFLDWIIFKEQKVLTVLKLNGSNLESIDGFSDEKGTEYDGKTTDMQMQIEGMDDRRPFRDALGNLTRLELQNNNLVTIQNLLARIPGVEYLDVSHNLLESIGKKSFSNLRKLKELRLNNNLLQLPHKEWFYTLVHNTMAGETTFLNISYNHWKCNCPTITFFEYYLKLGSEDVQDLAKSMQIQCFLPESMKGKLIQNVVEEIRVDNECPRASNEESTKQSQKHENVDERQYSRKGKENAWALYDGFLVDRYVSISIIFALLVAFLAHLYVQYHSHRRNMNPPPYANPPHNANPARDLRQPTNDVGTTAGISMQQQPPTK